jgi:signal transduction histidine kinase
MTRWLRAQFAAFGRSYERASAMAGSTPAATAMAAGTMILVFTALGYVPPLAHAAQLRGPWIALVLTGLAAVTTHTAWRHGCQGRVGTLATLLDHCLYLAAIGYVATHTAPAFGLGLSAVYAIVFLGGTVRLYSLTVLLVCGLATPLGLLLIVARPGPPVSFSLIGTFAVGIVWAYMDGHRKKLLERQAQLEQALGAADRAADESLQTALASMLLTLGHFIHELRGQQTAITLNLAYLADVPELDADARDALRGARQALEAQHKVIEQTVDQLRTRARPASTSFLPADVVGRFVAELQTLDTSFSGCTLRAEVTGDSEHLRIVLANLARNAEQAGATRLQFALAVEPSGRAIRLDVNDNGPGIPPLLKERLFRPFLDSTKAGGTGLGLYLCRRYVGLLGGRLSVGDGAHGGASFSILLPARVLARGQPSTPSIERAAPRAHGP